MKVYLTNEELENDVDSNIIDSGISLSSAPIKRYSPYVILSLLQSETITQWLYVKEEMYE